MKKVRITIRGKVQGVFFRANIEEKAKKLNIKGYVQNINNHIEAVFIGEEENVNKLLEFCTKGPEGAKVKSIELENCYENYDNFKIKY
ncbi:MAG: acylphosphatase [archaeon]